MSKQKPELRDIRFVTFQLIEDGTDGKKCRVRGEFAKADIATENDRIYPKNLWEREIKRLAAAMKERKVLGELDHPSDGKTLLSRASHLLTNLEISDDGTILGEAEALDTAKGKDLQALFKSGAKIGVSSRGFGSVKANSEGKDVVQEDYRLATFDFVGDPADNTAYPDPFYEHKEQDMEDGKKLDEAFEAKVTAEVSKRLGEAVQERETQIRAEMSESLTSALVKAKAELREEVRGEMLTDPSLAGARSALEKVKEILRPFVLPEDVDSVLRTKDAEIARLLKTISEKDLMIKGLEEDMEKLAGVARDAGFKYYLEKVVGANPDAELIRSLIGPIEKFESIEGLKTRLDDVTKQLTEDKQKREAEETARREAEEKKLAEEKAKVEAAEAEKQKLVEEVKAEAKKIAEAQNNELAEAKKTNAELMEAVEKALEANKQQALLLYAERKLSGNPRAIKIRKILESASVSKEEDVDAIISENSDGGGGGGGNIESIRERIRALGSGRTHTPLEEEAGNNRSKHTEKRGDEDDFQGLGVPLKTLRKASGLES